jgi:hypothetical protein
LFLRLCWAPSRWSAAAPIENTIACLFEYVCVPNVYSFEPL